MLGPYKLLAAGLVVTFLVGLSGYLGYDYGNASARAAVADRTLETVLSAYADLSDAEYRYADERAKKQRVVTRTLTEIRYAVSQLPARDCALQPAAHSLLVRARCAAAHDTTSPECVPGALLGAPGGAAPAQ